MAPKRIHPRIKRIKPKDIPQPKPLSEKHWTKVEKKRKKRRFQPKNPPSQLFDFHRPYSYQILLKVLYKFYEIFS